MLLFEMGSDHLALKRASVFGNHIRFGIRFHNVGNINQHFLVIFLAVIRTYI